MASAEGADWVSVAKGKGDDTDVCNFCRTPGAKLACSRCRAVKYCNAQCQHSDWTGSDGRMKHKTVCFEPLAGAGMTEDQAFETLGSFVCAQKAIPASTYIRCLRSLLPTPRFAPQVQETAEILRALTPRAGNPLFDLLCLDGDTPWEQPLPKLPVAKYLEVRDSPLAGKGLFATVDIPAGVEITTYGMQAVKVAVGYTPGMHYTQLRDMNQTIYLRTKYYTPDVDGWVDSHDLEVDAGNGVISICARYPVATPENCRFLASMCNDSAGPGFLDGIDSFEQLLMLNNADFSKRVCIYLDATIKRANCVLRRHRDGVTTLVSTKKIPAGTELTVSYGHGNWAAKLPREYATMDDFETRFVLLGRDSSASSSNLRKMLKQLVAEEMRDPRTMLCMCPRCTAS